jgi:uncharacterized protein (TIGR02246 family)
MLPRWLWAVMCACTASARADPSSALVCEPAEAEVAKVRAVAMGIVAADNARDIERVLSYYGDDAVLMPPGESAVAGRTAIRPRYESLFAQFDPRIETRLDEACVSGDLAIVRGHNGGRMLGRAGAAEKRLDDAFLMVLRRGPDGEWRISHLMWHGAGTVASPGDS